MKGRLYRFTPAGGKPEHFTHDFRSAAGNDILRQMAFDQMEIGDTFRSLNGTWERVA